MPDLIRFQVDDEVSIAVEVPPEDAGFQPAGADGFVWAQQTFGQAMDQARQVAEVAFDRFRRMGRRPDEIELTFGIKLTASAGAILAKAATEANVAVKLVWRAPAADDGADED